MPDRPTQTLVVAGQPVVIAWDEEARVWFVEASAVPGLAAEAATEEELAAELEVLVRTLTLP